MERMSRRSTFTAVMKRAGTSEGTVNDLNHTTWHVRLSMNTEVPLGFIDHMTEVAG